MDNLLQPILAEVDPMLLYVIAGFFGALILISVWKKAIKIVIGLTIVVGVLIIMAPMAKDFQQRYHFEIVDNTAEILSNGQRILINDIADIKSAEFAYTGTQQVDITIFYKQSQVKFRTPVFMSDNIREFLKRNGINCIIK